MIRKNRIKMKLFLKKFIVYLMLSIISLMIFIPFLFALSVSFSQPLAIYNTPYKWIPDPITFSNYAELFNGVRFNGRSLLNGFVNTISYITAPILVGVFTSAMAGYAFARINFKFRNVIFMLMISTMMIPGIITLVPSYIMWANVYKLAGTPWPLIIPGLFGAVMTMFFLKQFFSTLPKELEEAATIDGMNRFGIFLRIILPLSKAALITQVVLSFNGAYNDYLGPLLYVGSTPKLQTLQLMLSNLQTSFSRPYTIMMAGAVTALLPTLTLFVVVQRYFIEGIVTSGLK